MKAIVVRRTQEGEPQLLWKNVPDVVYSAGEVLVNVRATAVNRADLAQARGSYPPPPGVTDVLGLEMSGVIAAVGENVASWKVGDRVCALLPGGGYAEQVAVPAGMLLRLPQQWTFEQGAAVPEVWLTAFVNLFQEGGLRAGETVLIHAGGSGVGTAAIQLAREAECTVIVTAGAEEKLTACRELGARLAINYHQEDFATIISSQFGTVDLILDPVGANYFERNLQVLGQGGRLIQIGLLSGTDARIDLGLLLGKSLRIIGSRLRPRSVEEKIAITSDFRQRYWPLFEEGVLRPIIDTVFPLPEAGAAHDYVRENRNTGKVILHAVDR